VVSFSGFDSGQMDNPVPDPDMQPIEQPEVLNLFAYYLQLWFSPVLKFIYFTNRSFTTMALSSDISPEKTASLPNVEAAA